MHTRFDEDSVLVFHLALNRLLWIAVCIMVDYIGVILILLRRSVIVIVVVCCLIGAVRAVHDIILSATVSVTVIVSIIGTINIVRLSFSVLRLTIFLFIALVVTTALTTTVSAITPSSASRSGLVIIAAVSTAITPIVVASTAVPWRPGSRA